MKKQIKNGVVVLGVVTLLLGVAVVDRVTGPNEPPVTGQTTIVQVV